MDQPDSELNDAQALLRSLLGTVPFGIVVLDKQGKVKLANKHVNDLFDSDIPGNLIGQSLIQHIEHLHPLDEDLANYLKQPEAFRSFEPISFNNRSYDISIHAIHGGYMVIIYDITQMNALEANSIQAIITSQENERRRLAREIHDGIGPLLSSAKLELDLFLDDLNERDKSIPDQKLYHIRQTIDSISLDLRNLSHSLIPRLLEEFGLLSAFQNMVSRTKNSTKSELDLYCNLEPDDRYDKEIELNLYRCGQELLNNAIKHARANKIILQLIKHDDSIVLMVEDDGMGFSQDESKKSDDGIGLINIETRVRALNGDIIN